jgi:membrane-bound metal-dependent hydrolase YbcI (DUF457 family)
MFVALILVAALLAVITLIQRKFADLVAWGLLAVAAALLLKALA